jgi:hypothetical protein
MSQGGAFRENFSGVLFASMLEPERLYAPAFLFQAVPSMLSGAIE